MNYFDQNDEPKVIIKSILKSNLPYIIFGFLGLYFFFAADPRLPFRHEWRIVAGMVLVICFSIFDFFKRRQRKQTDNLYADGQQRDVFDQFCQAVEGIIEVDTSTFRTVKFMRDGRYYRYTESRSFIENENRYSIWLAGGVSTDTKVNYRLEFWPYIGKTFIARTFNKLHTLGLKECQGIELPPDIHDGHIYSNDQKISKRLLEDMHFQDALRALQQKGHIWSIREFRVSVNASQHYASETKFFLNNTGVLFDLCCEIGELADLIDEQESEVYGSGK